MSAEAPNNYSSAPRPTPQQRLTREQISTLVQQVGELTIALAEANPAEVYQQLGPRLSYNP